MIVHWLGPFSDEAAPIKSMLDSLGLSTTSSLAPHRWSRTSGVRIIVSEDLQLLENFEKNALSSQSAPALQASSHPVQSQQILVLSRLEFKKNVINHFRPSHRFYHISDEQTPAEFEKLIQFIQTKSEGPKPQERNRSPHLSMQNSLEVLKELTLQHIHEIGLFTQNDESRKKDFQSLIRLARTLTMNPDIEDVAQTLWQNAKKHDGILGLNILIGDLERPTALLHQVQGKYHLKKWEGESLVRSWTYRLSAETTSPSFFLLFAAPPQWQPNPQLLRFLNDRSVFFQLSLENALLNEEVKATTHLWINTFDHFRDPLAVISNSQEIHRANQSFTKLNLATEKLKAILATHDQRATDSQTSLHGGQTPSVEFPLDQRIFGLRRFPITSSLPWFPSHESVILHLTDQTHDRNLYSQLLQSEKMTAVGQLAGNLAQALTTPLEKIKQNCMMILEHENQDALLARDTSEILKAGERSLRIISDFQKFSEGQLDKEVFTAEELVERTIPLVKALLHGLRFQLQLSEERHSVRGSSSLLQQVLYNLLRNAHQAMDGRGELQIHTRPLEKDHQRGVKISVLDTGPGIPTEFIPKIFQPLQTTKDAKNGTGLGLHIVKKIITEHSGEVGFSNRPSGGTEFWFWLPLSERNPS